jgi:hypothetical protein
MAFDVKKLTKLDRIIVGAAAVARLSTFLPWWGYSGPLHLYGTSIIGWNAGFTAWFGALLLAAAGGFLLARRAGTKLPELPVGPAVVVLGASILGLAFIVLRWISLPRIRGGLAGSVGPRYGIWLAMLAGIVELVAAVAEFRASGESLPWNAPPAAPEQGGPATP